MCDSACPCSLALCKVCSVSETNQRVRSAGAAQALHGGWPAGASDAGPQRYGARAARWVRVDPAATLGAVLAAPDHVVPGVPVFFVVAAGTAFLGPLPGRRGGGARRLGLTQYAACVQS